MSSGSHVSNFNSNKNPCQILSALINVPQSHEEQKTDFAACSVINNLLNGGSIFLQLFSLLITKI